MAKRLTPKEKKFADEIINGTQQREAYKKAYNVKTKNLKTIDPNASRIASKKQVELYLANKVNNAKTIIEKLAESANNEAVRLQAAKDIIDRAEGKPVQRQINANTDTDKQYRWAE